MENNLQSSFEHAKRMFEQGNFNVCNTEMLSLINSGYEVATCHYYIGLIYLNLKRYDEAVNAFSKCISLDPQNINCLYSLAVAAEEQKYQDLALHYYYKVLNINSNHKNANVAISRLKGSQDSYNQSLSNYGNKGQSGNQPDFSQSSSAKQQTRPAEYKQDTSAKKKRDPKNTINVISLYDELLDANDRDSKIAVAMIKAAQMIDRTPRFSAFLGGILIRILLILTFVGIIILAISGGIRTMGGMQEVYFFTLPILFVLTVSLIYKLIKIKSTRITINNGFFEIKRGVFFRSEPLYYVHKTEHFDIYQNPLNIITGDGTFIFQVEITQGNLEKIKIKGLGSIKEMRQLKGVLQNLRIQLRNTPVIKSGIYG